MKLNHFQCDECGKSPLTIKERVSYLEYTGKHMGAEGEDNNYTIVDLCNICAGKRLKRLMFHMTLSEAFLVTKFRHNIIGIT